VRLKVTPEVEAYGILLIPHGLSGRAPAAIAQHGFGGSPETVAGLLKKEDEYGKFGKRLAERGYVVFAPRVMNNAKDRSLLARKGLLVSKRLIGLEVWKIMRVVDFLWSLKEANPARVGMAGLSQGGLTTLYAAACDERIAAAVVSGYFNYRTNKLVARSPHYTAYLDTSEDDKFIPGLLNEFSDCDLASLICPRPLFIEAGTQDKVCYVEDVRKEFILAREHYNRLGIGERIQLGIFEGQHAFHGVESFAFLDKWLKA
jgi:dienelactone hydrolase